jgi:hypothetical protein
MTVTYAVMLAVYVAVVWRWREPLAIDEVLPFGRRRLAPAR